MLPLLLPSLLLFCAGFAQPQGGQGARLLTADGLGPVRIGASVEEAARALGAPLRPRSADQSSRCWITGRADGREPGIAYLVAEGRVKRIDVFGAPEPKSRALRVASAAGGCGCCPILTPGRMAGIISFWMRQAARPGLCSKPSPGG